MNYSVEQLVREARVAIDRNNNSQPLASLGDVDTLTVDEIIESKIEDAARLVESSASHDLLDHGKPFGESVIWESQPGYGAGKINLPEDFMRLVVFRMSDWYTPATEVITDNDPLYLQQSSRYAGVRGNPQRPVVAIVHGATGQMLEFYSCQAGPGVQISAARYIPIPKIVDGQIDLCDKLKRAVVYRMASMTCATIGAGDLAAVLLGSSNEMAGIVSD
jgi:hypothetical protein